MAWRIREQSLRRAWGKRQARPGRLPEGPVPTAGPAGDRRFRAVLPPGTDALVPADARAAIVTAADRLLKGEWEILGVVRNDLCEPDWFYDPVTGHRSDPLIMCDYWASVRYRYIPVAASECQGRLAAMTSRAN